MFTIKPNPATLAAQSRRARLSAALLAVAPLLVSCAQSQPPAEVPVAGAGMKAPAPNTTPASESPVAQSAPAGGADLAPAPPPPAPGQPPAIMGRGGEGQAGAAKPSAAAKKDQGGVSNEPRPQPGLGTEGGETRVSKITTSPFVRADPASPFATASLFYNDDAGARALAGGTALQSIPGGSFSVGGGTVSVGLKDPSGRFFSAFIAGGRQVVIGSAGKSYTIVVKNNTANRFECVLSVDGLDVLDGKTAGFTKRGYILDAHGEIEVDGFRQTMDTVAAFRFGSVQSSYSNKKHGETRNVGVIGIALFNEQRGWDQNAVQRRRDANPFPGSGSVAP